MRKKYHIMLILVLLFTIGFTLKPVKASENLIHNSDFQQLSNGIPTEWYYSIWDKNNDSYSIYVDNINSHSGKNYITIENKKPNDSRLVQNVTVKPDTTYKLSAWVNVENATGSDKGANLTALYIGDTSPTLKNTNGTWEYIEFYGKTGPDQKQLELCLALGGYSSTTTGKASFDDISLEEVLSAPKEIIVSKLYRTDIQTSDITAKNDINPISIISKLFLYALIFIGAYWIINIKKENEIVLENKFKLKNNNYIIWGILICALILRLILAPLSKGHASDIYTFKYWAQYAASNGLSNFYNPNLFVDYPPGYIYVLYFLGKLQILFNLNITSDAFTFLIKLPAIFADIACIFVLYKWSKKSLGTLKGLALSTIYAFNPAIIINSAVWGQVDSFFALFIILTIIAATEDKLKKSAILFTLSVLIKPQAFIFTPILLFVFIKKKDIKLLGLSALYSLLVFEAAILPFSLKQNTFWIIDKYKSTLSSYPYGSVNSFNFFSLIGGNWAPDTTNLFFMSYKSWGFLFIISIVAFSAVIFFKSKKKSRIYYIAFFIITAVFVMSTKMHERYLFPALILSLLWYISENNKKILYLFAGITVTHYINVAYILMCSNNTIYQIPKWDLTLIFTSILNILIFLYTIKLGLDLYYNNKLQKFVNDKIPKIDSNKHLPKAGKKYAETELTKLMNKEVLPKQRLSKKDFNFMGVLVLLYSVIALYNLGTTKVPESYWKPYSIDESFSFDLGEEKPINTIMYYTGLSAGNYIIEASTDKATWHTITTIEQKSMYNWEKTSVTDTGRYIRITVTKEGGMLNELAVYGDDNSKPYKINDISINKIDTKDEGNPKDVFDEQIYATTTPTYLTGMYFDEIYHARTAYEQLHHLLAYEWTHPPFGKTLISLGVAIFGMNPFGWRIIGTLFGIAMIPLMYLMGRSIFKKSEYAFFAAFLMTFDFMHFTQTRISTIDVYSTFFIMCMYYFMYKYTKINFNKEGLKKSFIPLGLSGIFFAIGGATKWTCLYAAAGLAIILFYEFYQRYKEFTYANEIINSKNDALKKFSNNIKMNFQPYMLKTIAFCTLFFIVLPITVYLLSYIPFLNVPEPGHQLKDVFQLQSNMYNYHENLVATHPFSSTWYEWPIMKKPMWYYTGQGYLPDGKISSIVAMGNPAIWWVGILAFIATFIIGIKKRDKKVFFILVAAASEYVPWMLVPRLTFIYHYFTVIPFMMLCIVYVAIYLHEKYLQAKYLIYSYMAIVIILFIMFYPIMSGMIVDKSYVSDFLRWFNGWYFFS